MKVKITHREITSGGIRLMAYFITDTEDGREISQPFPSHYLARRELQNLMNAHSDVEIAQD